MPPPKSYPFIRSKCLGCLSSFEERHAGVSGAETALLYAVWVLVRDRHGWCSEDIIKCNTLLRLFDHIYYIRCLDLFFLKWAFSVDGLTYRNKESGWDISKGHNLFCHLVLGEGKVPISKEHFVEKNTVKYDCRASLICYRKLPFPLKI